MSTIPMAHSARARAQADEGPLYARIQRHFRDRIVSGDLKPGDRLPTEFDIAQGFSTSRTTVQTAMLRLVHEGWIERQAGRGTFVSDAALSVGIRLHEIHSFEDEVAAHGGTVTYRLLSIGRVAVDNHVARHLQVEPRSTTFMLERLRLLDGAIIGLERRFFAPTVPLDVSIDVLDRVSTHALIRDHLGIAIGRIEAEILAQAADDAAAENLAVAAGSPLLVRRHRIVSAAEATILYGEAFYVPPTSFRYVARAAQGDGA